MTLRHLSLGSLAAACSILALALACGGKNSSAPTTNLAGAWIGTVSTGESDLLLVMPSGGDYRHVSSSMFIASSGNLQISGRNLTGTATIFPRAGFPAPEVAGTLSGTASSASINAVFNPTDPTKGKTTISVVPDTAADSNAQLPGLAGTWLSQSNRNSSREDLTLTIDSVGAISATSNSGALAGTLAQPTDNANAFTVVLNVTPTDGSSPKKFTGAAYLREKATQLIINADDGKGFVAGIYTRQ